MTFAVYTDENIQLELVEWLANLGVDVLRCQDATERGDKDVHHLTIATELGRVVITRDLDFVLLSQEWNKQSKEHTGIIYISADRRDNTRYIVSRIMIGNSNSMEIT